MPRNISKNENRSPDGASFLSLGIVLHCASLRMQAQTIRVALAIKLPSFLCKLSAFVQISCYFCVLITCTRINTRF